MQGVVELRDGSSRIAERRVRGDVLDPLAVDVDLTPVAQGFQELRPGERTFFAFEDRFGML